MAPLAPRPRLTRARRSRPRGPRPAQARALALLDVVIGMSIFALIAIIAVVSMGQFKGRAYVNVAMEDARSVGSALEGIATGQGVYPGDTEVVTVPATATTAAVVNYVETTPALTLKLATLSPGNTVTRYDYTADPANGDFVTFCVVHKTGATADAWARYDSRQANVTAQGTGTPPATC